MPTRPRHKSPRRDRGAEAVTDASVTPSGEPKDHRAEPGGLFKIGLIALLAIWGSAALLVATRHYTLVDYRVVDPGADLPLGLILLTASPWQYLCVLALIACHYLGLTQPMSRAERRTALLALGCSILIPLLEWGRRRGLWIAPTYIEPLGLAIATGWAARSWRLEHALPASTKGFWTATLFLATLLSSSWYVWQSQYYFDRYLIGFNDVGQFALRVINTVQGKGFLIEVPWLPRFWDHFNPGLVVFVPVWLVFSDVRLFFVAQALSLTLPAMFVYLIARAHRASPPVAGCWALGWLANPILSQMNINYTYGWHPVSTVLPLLFASFWLLSISRFGWAFSLAVIACLFKENVIAVLCLFSLCMALAGATLRQAPARPWGQISPVVWAGLAAFFGIFFVVVYQTSGLAEFQTDRFGRLGQSTLEILSSPLTKPILFWGEVLRWRSLCFTVTLLIPVLGLRPRARAAWILAAIAVPLGVLLAWDHGPATSIGFQYATTLIPFVYLAAITSEIQDARASRFCLVASLCASLAFGGHVFSSRTLDDVSSGTYPPTPQNGGGEERFQDPDLRAWLKQKVTIIRQSSDSSCLATGRIAAHLLGVRQLETVGQIRLRWQHYKESGPPLNSFQWVVLDQREWFQQSPEDIALIEKEALASGFRIVDQADQILILRRSALSDPAP